MAASPGRAVPSGMAPAALAFSSISGVGPPGAMPFIMVFCISSGLMAGVEGAAGLGCSQPERTKLKPTQTINDQTRRMVGLLTEDEHLLPGH